MSGETKERPTHPFTQEQIAEWTAEGHWPLPPGMALMDRQEPDPAGVKIILLAVKAGVQSSRLERMVQGAIDNREG